MAYFKTKKALDAKMDIKWAQMRMKHPTYCLAYLNDMHELLDWYEHQLKNIKKK